MLLVLLLSFVVISVADEGTNDCDPWPVDVKTPAQCCVEFVYKDIYVESDCYEKCESLYPNEEYHRECAMKCYLSSTKLLVKDRINKGVAMYLLSSNYVPVNPDWLLIVSDAIDQCQNVTISHEDLHGSIQDFYECVESYRIRNCIEFNIYDPDCQKTEEHFMECNHILSDCSAWPYRVPKPTECCNTISLFTPELEVKCRKQCVAENFFSSDSEKCLIDCMYNETGIYKEGQLDMSEVKKVLITNSNDVGDWLKVINEAVDECASRNADNTNKNARQSFRACTELKLSENCPSLRDDFECNKTRMFMSQCPDTKPELTVPFYSIYF